MYMMLNDVDHGAASDDISSVFQPDTLLPAQFFETFGKKDRAEPEIGLMLAVLEDGLAIYQKHFAACRGRALRLFRETEEWIYREVSNRPFSFCNICEVVGFDPEYIRRGLLKWRQARSDEIASMHLVEPMPARIKIPRTAHGRREAA